MPFIFGTLAGVSVIGIEAMGLPVTVWSLGIPTLLIKAVLVVVWVWSGRALLQNI